MSTVILTLAAILIGIQSLVMTWMSIRGLSEFTQEKRLIDFGSRRMTVGQVIGSVFFAVSSLFMAYGFLQSSSDPMAIAMAIFVLGLMVQSIINAIPRLGFYEQGLRVMSQMLWFRSPTVVPWESIKHYEWTESGRLSINPGFHAIRCIIPEELTAEVEALLKSKCPLPITETHAQVSWTAVGN